MPSFATPTAVLMHYLQSVTQAPAKMQQDVLASILQTNSQCEYLRSRDLDGKTDAESFRSCIPISTYDTIKHHLARIVNGDNRELPLDTPGQGVLCSPPIVELIARYVCLQMGKRKTGNTYMYTYKLSLLTSRPWKEFQGSSREILEDLAPDPEGLQGRVLNHVKNSALTRTMDIIPQVYTSESVLSVSCSCSTGTSGGVQKMFPKVESDRSKMLLFTMLTSTVVNM